MTNLYPPPPVYDLPLSLGGDLIVDFVRVDTNGDPLAYDPGTIVKLTIDTAPATTATATITDEHALVKIESTALDPIPKRTLWRAVVSLTTDPSTELVVANGKTSRADG